MNSMLLKRDLNLSNKSRRKGKENLGGNFLAVKESGITIQLENFGTFRKCIPGRDS